MTDEQEIMLHRMAWEALAAGMLTIRYVEHDDGEGGHWVASYFSHVCDADEPHNAVIGVLRMVKHAQTDGD